MNAELGDAQLDDAHRKLLSFAKLLTETPAKTTDADVEQLRVSGWKDPQIAEAVYIVSLFAFFNRLADAFGLTGDDFQYDPKKS